MSFMYSSVSCHKFCETFFSVETMHSRDIEHTKILIYAVDLPKGFLSLLVFYGAHVCKIFSDIDFSRFRLLCNLHA